MSGATATIQNKNARGKGERGGRPSCIFYLSKSDWRRGDILNTVKPRLSDYGKFGNLNLLGPGVFQTT